MWCMNKCLSLIFIFPQMIGCRGLEREKHTSCRDLRTNGGFKYSWDIHEELEMEEWTFRNQRNLSQVLAHRQKGTAQETAPEVIEMSHASITLHRCVNVTYRTIDIFNQETWVFFITADEAGHLESKPPNSTTALACVGLLVGLILPMAACYLWRRTKRSASFQLPSQTQRDPAAHVPLSMSLPAAPGSLPRSRDQGNGTVSYTPGQVDQVSQVDPHSQDDPRESSCMIRGSL
ncbi:hypothetical protein MATL_G00219510 [Megalops atlanticus]|uniref:Uncharacterized protein n=1 Tax=Megalops atlanticus TaxID=7932 RepID=A0A9D3PHF2_MEGAT|nr:hypothetical protein MATL_G00219510 [Megalops atlanticus]